jgi:hypothetical protein
MASRRYAVAIVNPTPKQARNLRDLPAGPGPVPSDSLAEVQAAMAKSMADSAARQEQTRVWLARPLTDPQPSGDRVSAQPGHAGHVGDVLGLGASPGQDLLPAATSNPRIPPPAPPPPKVTSSTTRPRLSPGFWFADHTTTRPASPASVVYVTTDEPAPAKQAGLLARLAAWFKGGSR